MEVIKGTKSAYQIAQELGVTPQAVYKRITPELILEMNGHVSEQKNGRFRFDSEGERILKALFLRPTYGLEKDKEISFSEVVFLRQRIDSLEKQLEIERQHGRELAMQVASYLRKD